MNTQEKPVLLKLWLLKSYIQSTSQTQIMIIMGQAFYKTNNSLTFTYVIATYANSYLITKSQGFLPCCSGDFNENPRFKNNLQESYTTTWRLPIQQT